MASTRRQTTSDRSLETIEILNQELADVEQQLADGDIDEATAQRLTDRYAAELSAVVAARSVETDDSSDDIENEATWLTKRAKIGILVVALAVSGIATFAVVSLAGDSTSGVEGVAQAALTDPDGRDLSTVSNDEMEAVVGENPGVIPMRLALARRYFEEGDFDKALDHYFVILESEQNPEALANVGWMTYLSGYDDLAAGYLEAALERDPTFLTARWFLGNVYVSLGRNDEAIVMLATVASSDDTPQEIKDLALELIATLRETDG